MIPDAIRRKWAAKAELLPDLALPYASTTSLTLSGHGRDRELLGALRLLIDRHPDELPLDGGPAKCRPLDIIFYDEFVRSIGSRPRGLRALEAVWLATDESLCYVSPQVGQYVRWPWSELTVTPRKQGRRFGRISITTPDGAYEMGLGSVAMANLLTIYAWSHSES